MLTYHQYDSTECYLVSFIQNKDISVQGIFMELLFGYLPVAEKWDNGFLRPTIP